MGMTWKLFLECIVEIVGADETCWLRFENRIYNIRASKNGWVTNVQAKQNTKLRLQTARRIGKVPRSWNQSGGHDPTNAYEKIFGMYA